MNHRKRAVGRLALAMCVAAAAGTAAAGQITRLDGIPHVHNGETPALGRETVQLEELWRAGGPDDEFFFGLITQVRADEAGNIYLLDSQLCEVVVYSPDGERRRTLFREGEGPGEVTRPRDMALLGDGSVGVIREFPGLMVRVDRRNSPLPNIEIPSPDGTGYVMTDACHAGGNTLVLGGTVSQQAQGSTQKRTHYLGIFDLEGNQTARLLETSHQRDFQNLVIAEREVLPTYWWACDVGPGGRVHAAPDRDRYVVEIFSPQGELEQVVTRDYEHCRRTDEAWQRLYDSFEVAMEGADIPYTIEIERDEPDILAMQHGVRVRRDGSLWVLPSRGVHNQPPGVMLTFDVFDREGHFERQISYACPHDGVWDGFFFVGPDRAVVVTGHAEAVLAQYGGGNTSYQEGEEAAAMEVICYRIPAP